MTCGPQKFLTAGSFAGPASSKFLTAGSFAGPTSSKCGSALLDNKMGSIKVCIILSIV
jgi:hypothetical protein